MKEKRRRIVDDALRAALNAYRRTMIDLGERGQPCRAALKAYCNVRPGDKKASERVIAALALAIRHYPKTFTGCRHAAS